MRCEQARARWHRRHDDKASDPALDAHLAGCGACRAYDAQMRCLLDGLARLRAETEGITPAETDVRRSRPVGLAAAWPRVLAAAACIALAALGSWVFLRPATAPSRIATVSHPPLADNGSRRLGLTLRGESAASLLAVATPTDTPNVQVYFLYPRLDAVATRDEPPTRTP